MATITFDRVSKRFDDDRAALADLDLQVEDGEFLILVGPSGCGKSTALRIVAGLESPTSGRLLIGGKIANEMAPRDRNVAMVFQSYALYPHLSVAQNIAFGLRVRGVGRPEMAAKVRAVAATLELTDYLARRPAQLSGGQRQRVAMARALVRSPGAFLMDEPLSNLDARLRGQMREEIAALQRRTGVTTLYVTHDQVEAMTMGDRVAVLDRGVLQQVGPSRTLYDAPDNRFVAGFIGSPAMNFLPATVEQGEAGLGLRLGPQHLRLDAADVARFPSLAGRIGGHVVAGLRPEAFRPMADAGATASPGHVRFVEDFGATRLVSIDVEGIVPLGAAEGGDDDFATRRHIKVIVDGALYPRTGDRIALSIDTSRLHLFDARTGASLRG